MRLTTSARAALLGLALAAPVTSTRAQMGANPTPAHLDSLPPSDTAAIRTLVGRLELGRYKETVRGLTRFGDRRQGTDRNRQALDWIEQQLRASGCTNTERLTYTYEPPPPRANAPTSPSQTPGRRVANSAPGGARLRGTLAPIGVNVDSLAQPDARLRALNSQPSAPGERQEVWCTKVGATRPDEMYIVGAHMDGIGWGEAANDDGSGTAIVMELARIFSDPAVRTERSIRFVLWNNEETGLNGARAYVEQRRAMQGREDPPGSGRYPEPRWLGMIQHDMMMFDHGMPGPGGAIPPRQRPEADVNIEFQSTAAMAAGAQRLAWILQSANDRFATDYPAAVGQHMTNTDSSPFQDLIPAVSLRENERGAQIGAGWNPHWHQPTDVFATFSDDDFRLGLNAAQTTLGALGWLAGATLRR